MENVKDIAVEFGEWVQKKNLLRIYPIDDWLEDAGYGLETKMYESSDASWLSMSELFDEFSAEKKQEG